MPSFTRARKPEEKESRRAHVLKTARTLLQNGTPLQELGLNELARHAEMTKSNLYRYFESREHVLLELLRDEWSTWFAALSGTWRRAPNKHSALSHLARHFARSLARQPLLCELTSALPSVLERNLSETAILSFKRESLTFFEQAATFISTQVPELSKGAAFQLMHDGAALVTGIWPHAHPAPAVARVIASQPELCSFARNFEADLSRLLHASAVNLSKH
jgi:AcrR family transcriptional regulator